MEVRINGKKIMPPSVLSVSRFNIMREDRVASGEKVADVTATKRTIAMSWNIIYDDKLQEIINLLDSSFFNTFTYPDPKTSEETVIVASLAEDISATSWGLYGGQRIWKDVSFTIEER